MENMWKHSKSKQITYSCTCQCKYACTYACKSWCKLLRLVFAQVDNVTYVHISTLKWMPTHMSANVNALMLIYVCACTYACTHACICSQTCRFIGNVCVSLYVSTTNAERMCFPVVLGSTCANQRGAVSPWGRIYTHIGCWGKWAQPGNRFVSFVHVCSRWYSRRKCC